MVRISENPQQIVEALGFYCKKKGHDDLLPFLEIAKVTVDEIDYYNGKDGYRADLQIPFETFIELGEDKHQVENRLSNYARDIFDNLPSEYISQVNLLADISEVGSWRSGEAPLEARVSDIARLWKEGHFRLFLSHSSYDKAFGAQLKHELKKVRIDTFVAHEDIEPNLAWQQEIKLALASCHAILFLSSEESNVSVWCQQELGWAMGRGILHTTYKYPIDPTGFIGAIQGWRAKKDDFGDIRLKLLNMFVRDDRTEQAMREPLVQLVQSSNGPEKLHYSLTLVDQLKSLSTTDMERIYNVLSQPFITEELGDWILNTLDHFGYIRPNSKVQSEDEYDPFAD